nr:MAG TPA: hypothetical protein [Caudoviricetes sp.]
MSLENISGPWYRRQFEGPTPLAHNFCINCILIHLYILYNVRAHE